MFDQRSSKLGINNTAKQLKTLCFYRMFGIYLFRLANLVTLAEEK
jgi:hypothetical protein